MINNEEKTTTTTEENIAEVNDAILEVTVDKTENDQEIIENNSEEKSKSSYLNLLTVSIVDQLVVLPLSVIAVFLGDIILRLFGYHIVELLQVFMIVYIAMNILYSSICKLCRLEGSFGERIVTNRK